MTMRDEDIDVADFLVLEKLDAERPQSRAGVENEHTLTATNLDARRIAAIANCCWARDRECFLGLPRTGPA